MRTLFLVGALTLLIAATSLPASGAGQSQTVLVVYSNERSLPANRQIDEKLRESLAANTNLELNYQTEFLDYPRYADDSDEAYDILVSNFLRAKYADESIDVVVAAGPAAFRFLRRHQNDLFVNTSILAIAISTASYEDQPLPSRFLSIPISIEPKPTLEMALRLQPGACEIVVVTGASNFDLNWEKRLRSVFNDWQTHPPVRFLSGLPLTDDLNEVSRLPTCSIVYSPGLQRDGAGKSYSNRDSVSSIAQASSAPVYSSYGTMINFGIVGGYLFEMADVGQQAGEVVRRVLAGEKLTQKDMPGPVLSHYAVDWNQLQRWQLSEANLPPGTIIVNREPGLWQKYKDYIFGVVLLVALQTLLIFYLLLERRRRRVTQKQLADRLKFETLLAEVSATFANPATPGIDNAIHESLQKVGSFFGGGIASIWQWSEKSPVLLRTHAWSGIRENFSREVPAAYFSNATRQLAAGEDIYFSNETEMQKLEDNRSFRKSGIKAFLAIPLRDERQFIGALSISNHEREMAWPPDFVTRMHTIAEILGSALARKIAADDLRESELLTGSILESLRSSVAIVDNQGTILEVNQRWLDFASANSNSQIAKVTAGVNYLDVCRRAAPNEETEEARRGIQSVLNGSQQMFEMDYSCDSPSEQRWFRLTVALLPRNRGGAVISHLNITEQKLAELEQRRMKEETAQMNRAREMGQLAASLIHELAQPLGAMLSNAQAAARLATSSELDLPEIQEALADIIKDDKRAGAVLDSVRAILKKHTIRPHAVNLNEIVEDVALIVRSDALLNGVQFRSMLCSDAIPVQGDEVPLQQVLLNLVNNAMAAMRQIPRERRTLTIKTQVQNGFGWLVVEDEGPGIPDSLKAKLFQPFFTTKSEGLGMGLSICATILESLGGSISFANVPGRGAAFSVQLPLAQSPNSLE
jgi:two-component system, LuxR family, sensor kinase FixL